MSLKMGKAGSRVSEGSCFSARLVLHRCSSEECTGKENSPGIRAPSGPVEDTLLASLGRS